MHPFEGSEVVFLQEVAARYCIIAAKDALGGTYSSVIEKGDGFLVVKNYQHSDLHHGSATPVANFKVGAGSGRFGKGLYLTPSKETAEFYSKGGRQGNAGQKLDKQGHTYTFAVNSPVAVIVTDEHEFSSFMVSEDEGAEEAFQDVGDLESARVTKNWARFAEERWGAGVLVYAEKEASVLTPLDQVVVLNDSVVKKV